MSDEKIKELLDAYKAAEAQRVAAVAAYRVAAVAASRVADDAWDEYQSALKAKGGKP